MGHCQADGGPPFRRIPCASVTGRGARALAPVVFVLALVDALLAHHLGLARGLPVLAALPVLTALSVLAALSGFAGLDGDLLGLVLRHLADVQLQHSVSQVGLNVLAVHAFRQRERAAEGAVGALIGVILVVLALL